MSQENVEIVLRSVDAFNEGGLEAAAQFAHPEIEFEEPPTQPAPRTAQGQAATEETWGSFEAAWEEHRTEVKEVRELTEDEVLLASVEHFRGGTGWRSPPPAGRSTPFVTARSSSSGHSGSALKPSKPPGC